jgi:hypothetical protein
VDDTAIPLPPAPSVTPQVRVSPHRPAVPVEVEERAHHTAALHDLCTVALHDLCSKCDQCTYLGRRPRDGWEGVQKGEGVDLGHRLRLPGEAIHGHYTGTHGHLHKACRPTGAYSKCLATSREAWAGVVSQMPSFHGHNSPVNSERLGIHKKGSAH